MKKNLSRSLSTNKKNQKDYGCKRDPFYKDLEPHKHTKAVITFDLYDLGREISYYTVLKGKKDYKQIVLWCPTRNFI